MSEPYELRYTEHARSNLKRLDKATIRRIHQKLKRLAANAGELSHYPLKGEFKGLYRLRIGDYRAIYRLDHNSRLLEVKAVGHRSTIYDD